MKIFIKPASPGLIVRHPDKLNYRIPDEGEEVIDTPQWQRYIDAGDVVIVEQGTQEKPKKGDK